MFRRETDRQLSLHRPISHRVEPPQPPGRFLSSLHTVEHVTPIIEGVVCPLVTPMRDGDVDTDSLGRHVEWLIEAGVDGVVPCGTTGEFASLTDEERTRVVDATVSAAGGRVPVVAGAADTTVAGAADTVEAVTDRGADAALLPPPYYHGGSDSGLARFYEAALEESSGNVVLYNFPALTGQSIPVDVLADLAERDRVVGCKDSSGDFEYALRARSATPADVPIAVGADRLLATAAGEGFAGGVVGLSNVVPDVMCELYDAAAAGELERAHAIRERRVDPILDAVGEHGYVPLLKRLLADDGIVDEPTVKPPLVEAPASAVDGLRR